MIVPDTGLVSLRPLRLFAAAFVALGFFSIAHAERPALVVQITVDQLRGDLLERGRTGFGRGGPERK